MCWSGSGSTIRLRPLDKLFAYNVNYTQRDKEEVKCQIQKLTRQDNQGNEMVVVAVAGSPVASEAVRTLALVLREDQGMDRAAAKVADGTVNGDNREVRLWKGLIP